MFSTTRGSLLYGRYVGPPGYGSHRRVGARPTVKGYAAVRRRRRSRSRTQAQARTLSSTRFYTTSWDLTHHRGTRWGRSPSPKPRHPQWNLDRHSNGRTVLAVSAMGPDWTWLGMVHPTSELPPAPKEWAIGHDRQLRSEPRHGRPRRGLVSSTKPPLKRGKSTLLMSAQESHPSSPR